MPAEDPANLTVALLSDLHVEPTNVENRLDELDAVCERLLAGEVYSPVGEPDLLVVLGDLIRDFDAESDRETLTQVGGFLSDLPIPVEVTLGNHDVAALDSDEARAALGIERSWFVDTDRELAVFDTASPRLGDARGELTDEQAELLRSDVAPMDHGIVLSHHPLQARDVSENPWFAMYPEEAFAGNRRAYVDRGHEGTAVVVSGHLHDTYLAREEGTISLGVDAFNKVIGHGQNGACALVSRTSDSVTVVHKGGDGAKHVGEWSLDSLSSQS